MSTMRLRTANIVSAMATEMPRKRRIGDEAKGFVDEMRAVVMKLHTRNQAKEGEKEPEEQPLARWEPTMEGYLRFLVDSKVVYDTLESIVEVAACPWCSQGELAKNEFVCRRSSLKLGVSVKNEFVCR